MENLEFEVADISSVPEAMRGLYSQDGDVHRLNVNGLPKPEDTSGLKRALDVERENAKAAKKYESLGKTPEEIREMIAADESRKAKKLADEGDFKTLLEQHQKKSDAAIAEANARADKSDAALQSFAGKGALAQELAKAGVTEEGADLLPSKLLHRIKVGVENGQVQLNIMQADGETPMAGSSENGTATLGDLVNEAVGKYPSSFNSGLKSGGGMRPNSGGGTATGPKSWGEAKTAQQKVELLKSKIQP